MWRSPRPSIANAMRPAGVPEIVPCHEKSVSWLVCRTEKRASNESSRSSISIPEATPGIVFQLRSRTAT